MKHFRTTIIVSALSFFISFANFAISSETATKEECVEKCHAVARIISTNGAEEAIKQVNNVNGPYVWKDTYVYIMDMNATIVAHGPQPKFIGKSLMGLKDPINHTPWYPALFERISEGAQNGWFDYHWKKPGSSGIYTKDCYFEKSGDLVVFAGIYGDKVK